MDTETVAPATPTSTGQSPDVPITSDTTNIPAPELSVADHEAQYGPKKAEAAPGEPQAEKPRHRAKSQLAKSEDAPRINELTKRLRDAERERDEWRTKASSRPEPVAAPTLIPAATTPSAPATGKPTWAQFEADIGQKYDTWGAAQDAFVDARDEWREAQSAKTRQESESTQRRQQEEQATIQTYVERAQAFAKTTPDFFEKTGAAKAVLDAAPDLLTLAVIQHEQGPKFVYDLVSNPAYLDEMTLLTDGKAVTANSVAIVQRRLSSYRSPAAATGSAPPMMPRSLAPRPPNPVRTGPLKPSDDAPGDDASVAEHERYYGRKRR